MKTILFDFDGTLTDSFQQGLKLFNSLAHEYHYRKIKRNELKRLRNLPAREVQKILGISAIKMLFLVRRVRKELSKSATHTKLIPGWKKTLVLLKKQGYCLGIVTSNSHTIVKDFLKRNKINVFDFIKAGVRVFGKKRAIKKVLLRNAKETNNTVYVGDETRDIEAARKSNIKIIAVAWGFNSEKALKKMKPDAVIKKPEELIQALKRLFT